MGLILDTSVLIASEKRRIDLPKLYAAYPDEAFCIAAITASELLHGVARASPPSRKKERSEFVEAALAQLDAVDFDLAVARRHADLWAELEKKGQMIGAHDLLIAATALHYAQGVVTMNVTEFRQVPKLRIVDAASFTA